MPLLQKMKDKKLIGVEKVSDTDDSDRDSETSVERKERRKRKRWGLDDKEEEKEEEKGPEPVDPTKMAFVMQPVKPIFTPAERVDMEKRVTAIKFIRQMVKYFFFLILFTMVTLSTRPRWGFQSSQVLLVHRTVPGLG